MTTDILMPPLSQTMDSLVLVEWLKKIGESVNKGEALFSVETDKATLEVESPAHGYLVEMLAQPNDEVKVGSIIGKLSDSAEVKLCEPTIASHATMEERKSETIPTTSRIFISPRARRLMQEKHLLLDMVGSGVQGAIVERDVLAYLQKHPSFEEKGFQSEKMGTFVPSSGAQLIELTPTRKAIAQHMAESYTPVSYQREVDATVLVDMRQRIQQQLAQDEINPSITDFLMAFTCNALARFPVLNATFDGKNLMLSEHIHLALAIDTERGLLAPVILDAQLKNITALAAAHKDLKTHARDNTLETQTLSGGTFTLTNLGALGVDTFTPIINPPQVAILGVGRIRDAVAVFDGQICVRKVMNLCLTCERIIDGALAARFLAYFAALMETPEMLLLF